MIDSYFRKFYQQGLVDPFVNVLVKHISPQSVTGAALISGCAAAVLVPTGFPALVALGVSGYCDTLDGSLARAANVSSPKGAVLDIVSDRIVEGALVMGLYSVQPEERALACLAMMGAILICVTSFLVVGIFSQNQSEKSFHYSPGIMERTEAFIFFAAMILFPGYFQPLAWTFSLLVLATGLLRIRQFAAQQL